MKSVVKLPASASWEDRRQQIMSAALDVIAEKGLEGVRTRDIAARVPMNVATLHYYFPSKAELLVAVTDYARDLFIAAHGARAGASPSGDPVIDFVSHGWVAARKNQSLGRAVMEIMARAPRDADARKAVNRLYRGWHASMVVALREAVEIGRYRPDLDLDETADILIAFLIGGKFLGFTTTPTPRARRYVEHLCDLFTSDGPCGARMGKRRSRAL